MKAGEPCRGLAWEVNRNRCMWTTSGRATSAAISACRAACVCAAQRTGWAGAHHLQGGEVEVCAPSPAVGAYGWTGAGLVDAMLAIVRNFVEVNPEFIKWGATELAHMERNADLFRAHLGE